MANLSIIRDLIKKNGFTIRGFAEDLGMSEQGLQKLIRENSTKVDTLEKIAKGLKVSPIVFFDENPIQEEEDLKKLIDNNSLLVQTNAKLTDRLLELTSNNIQ